MSLPEKPGKGEPIFSTRVLFEIVKIFPFLSSSMPLSAHRPDARAGPSTIVESLGFKLPATYLKIFSKIVELAKPPTLIHLTSFQDLPSEQEKNNYMFLLYLPPTSYKAFVICPSEQYFVATSNCSKIFFPSRAFCCNC